jgi:hypothetical protein
MDRNRQITKMNCFKLSMVNMGSRRSDLIHFPEVLPGSTDASLRRVRFKLFDGLHAQSGASSSRMSKQ